MIVGMDELKVVMSPGRWKPRVGLRRKSDTNTRFLAYPPWRTTSSLIHEWCRPDEWHRRIDEQNVPKDGDR